MFLLLSRPSRIRITVNTLAQIAQAFINLHTLLGSIRNTRRDVGDHLPARFCIRLILLLTLR